MSKLNWKLNMLLGLKGKDGFHSLFDFVVNIDLKSFIFMAFGISS
jgi:hypothetical protein